MKNILYIATYKFIKPNGGGKVSMLETISNLHKVANITVISTDNNENDTRMPVPIHGVLGHGASRYFNPFTYFKIKKIIQEKQIDTLIMDHPYYGWMGLLLKKFTGIKYFVRSQNVEFLRFKDLGKWWWPIMKHYEKFIHNHADAVLCITEEDFTYFKNQGVTSKLVNIPFGTNETASPSDNKDCNTALKKIHQLSDDTRIILYNGSLSYLPNIYGLDFILEKLNPLLQTQLSNYKIVICGGGLQQKYNGLKDIPNVIYAGFVDDISVYCKGADVFINPVFGGGGIKTKLVDALSYGTTSISSADGAKGLVAAVAGSKLRITPDHDAQAMAHAIVQYLNTENVVPTPDTYYEYYNWQKIIHRILSV